MASVAAAMDTRQDSAIPFPDESDTEMSTDAKQLDGHKLLGPPWRCPLCQQPLATERSTQRHILSQHADKPSEIVKYVPFHCPDCHCAYKTKVSLAGHKCEGPKSQTQRKSSTKQKQGRKRQRLAPVKDCCNADFASEHNYWRHMATEHNQGTCSHTFFLILAGLLTGHLVNSQPCPFCTKVYSRSDKLKAHIIKKHDHGEEKKLEPVMISSCEHNETWWLHTAPQGARS
jgi:hypothetical protein